MAAQDGGSRNHMVYGAHTVSDVPVCLDASYAQAGLAIASQLTLPQCVG
jgi:hypothetical protein